MVITKEMEQQQKINILKYTYLTNTITKQPKTFLCFYLLTLKAFYLFYIPCFWSFLSSLSISISIQCICVLYMLMHIQHTRLCKLFQQANVMIFDAKQMFNFVWIQKQADNSKYLLFYRSTKFVYFLKYLFCIQIRYRIHTSTFLLPFNSISRIHLMFGINQMYE